MGVKEKLEKIVKIKKFVEQLLGDILKKIEEMADEDYKKMCEEIFGTYMEKKELLSKIKAGEISVDKIRELENYLDVDEDGEESEDDGEDEGEEAIAEKVKKDVLTLKEQIRKLKEQVEDQDDSLGKTAAVIEDHEKQFAKIVSLLEDIIKRLEKLEAAIGKEAGEGEGAEADEEVPPEEQKPPVPQSECLSFKHVVRKYVWMR